MPVIMERRRFLQTTALGAGVISATGCLSSDSSGEGSGEIPNPLRIGFPSPVPGGYYLAVYPALQRVLAEDDIEIERKVFSSHTATAAAFIQDEIDIGYISVGALMNARSEGMPMVCPLEYTQGNMFTMVSRPELSNWSDIEGSTVAVHSPTSPTYTAAQVMVEDELGSTDAVEYKFIFGSSNRVSALKAGEIDATTVYTLDALQLEEDGAGNVMGIPWNYDRLTGHSTLMWTILKTKLEEREQVVGNIVDKILTAQNNVYETEMSSVIQGAEDSGIFPEYAQTAWETTLKEYRNIGLWSRNHVSDATIERFDKGQDRLIETGLIPKENRIDASKAITDRFA